MNILFSEPLVPIARTQDTGRPIGALNYGSTPTRIEINVPDRDVLFRSLKDRFAAREGFSLATMNLDHLTKLRSDPEFLEAYRTQDMVVADGRPVVWLSHVARKPVKLLPGSDMILPMCELCASMDVSVAMVGSSDDALAGAAKALKEKVPGLKVEYLRAPSYGFDPNGEEADTILKEVRDSGAGLCLIALGAPKQEVFGARGRMQAPQVGFASIGAGLDFLSGHQVRAPRIMRALALEWLWRMLQSPRRMVPRYAKCFAILPGLILQAWRQRT